MILSCSTAVFAQDAQPAVSASSPRLSLLSFDQGTPAAAPATPAVTAGWQDGFFIQSADGDFRMQFGLFGQFDGRFAFGDDNNALVDTFGIRRIRPILRGRAMRYLEFALAPDFAGGTASLQDAYIDLRFSPTIRMRVGKAKAPASFEQHISDAYLMQMERSLASNITPNRDVGIQILGDLAKGRVSFMAGIVNGTRDGSSSDLDTNDGKDVGGRVLVRPITGLGVGVAASTGRQAGAAILPVYRTTIFQQTFYSYANSTADGRLNRSSGWGSYYRKSFGSHVEYTRSALPVRSGDTRTTIAHQAWQVAGSYVLTGETATENGVTPRANFNPARSEWGAFQIAARYNALAVDRTAFDLGLAAAGSSREAEGWSVGLNWYLNRILLCRVMFEQTVFDNGVEGARPSEHVLAIRSQIYF